MAGVTQPALEGLDAVFVLEDDAVVESEKYVGRIDGVHCNAGVWLKGGVATFWILSCAGMTD